MFLSNALAKMVSLKEKLSYKSEERNVAFLVEHQKIWVSKEVLSMYSPVFKSMFYSSKDFRDRNKDFVELPGKTVDEIIELLACIFPYPEQKQIDEQNVDIIFRLSDEFEIELLKNRCLPFLESSITNENVESILRLATTCKSSNLKTCCTKFLAGIKIEEANFKSMMHLAEEFDIDHLKTRCENFLINQVQLLKHFSNQIYLLKGALKYKLKDAIKVCIRQCAVFVPVSEIIREKGQLPSSVIFAMLEAKSNRLEFLQNKFSNGQGPENIKVCSYCKEKLCYSCYQNVSSCEDCQTSTNDTEHTYMNTAQMVSEFGYVFEDSWLADI